MDIAGPTLVHSSFNSSKPSGISSSFPYDLTSATSGDVCVGDAGGAGEAEISGGDRAAFVVDTSFISFSGSVDFLSDTRRPFIEPRMARPAAMKASMIILRMSQSTAPCIVPPVPLRPSSPSVPSWPLPQLSFGSADAWKRTLSLWSLSRA